MPARSRPATRKADPPDVFGKIHVFPVRHHSPAASAELAQTIRALRPQLILIEGPVDATFLIPLIASSESQPPLAIYAYRQNSEPERPPDSALWPFCAYSPEYVAILEGAKIGARIAFCDLPSLFHFPGTRISTEEVSDGATLAVQLPAPDATLPGDPAEAYPLEPPPATSANEILPFGSTFAARLAEKAGFRSFEEFWEARWEMGEPGAFTPALMKYAHLLRQGEVAEATPDGALDALSLDRTGLREAMMWWSVLQAVEQGFDPERILIVCGAYHAVVFDHTLAAAPPVAPLLAQLAEADPAAFTLAPVEPGVIVEERKKRRKGDESEIVLTLIPYSYLRLSEQTGYGAGNRAPAFYRNVWTYMQQALDGGERNRDKHPFAAAARETLIRLRRELDQRGQNASLADAIEAYRLAQTLAALRDKPAAGMAEVEEAALACMARGSEGMVRPLVQQLLVGDAIGRVSTRLIVRSALQREFYTTVSQTNLPLKDMPVNKDLALTNPTDQIASLLLHRLQILDVPFAHLRGSNEQVYSKLVAVRESWEVRWSPLVDTRLVELSALGNSLSTVGARLVTQQLGRARGIDVASELLLSAALAGLDSVYEAALQRCDELSSGESGFIKLAQACQNLTALLHYRQVRNVPLGPVAALLERLYRRAVGSLLSAGRVDEAAARETGEAMKMLYNVLQQQRQLEVRLYAEALAQVRDDDAGVRNDGREPVHPYLQGLALSLLVLLRAIDEEGLAVYLRQALSPASGTIPAAHYLSGFLALNTTYLVRSRPVIASLNTYLQGLEAQEFLRVLPILRRTLAGLSSGEKGYLLEMLSALLGFTLARNEHLPVSAELMARVSLVDAEVKELLQAIGDTRP